MPMRGSSRKRDRLGRDRLQSVGKLIILAIFALTGPLFPLGGPEDLYAQESLVTEIQVRGNRKIDTFAILAKVRSETQRPLDQEQVREDLKAIYQMGFFEDVTISTEETAEGVRLIFMVEEKPFLIDIQLAGNDELDTETLEEKISIKPQTFVDYQQIKENAERLRKHYEESGYYGAGVLPFLKTVDEDKVALTFYIEEGNQAKIRRIRFEGGDSLSDGQIKDEIKTRRYFWLTSWLTGSGIYNREVVEQDVERIKDLYLNHGFLQAQVGSPEVHLSEDKRWFEIVFPIVEGEPFTVRTIHFSGNALFEDEALRSLLKLKEGDVMSHSLLQEDIRSITEAYGERGYIFTRVLPQLEPDPESRTVELTLRVQEEGPVEVRRIQIMGNDKTRDKVIRREIRVDEQEVIDTQALRRSFQRLNNLNFFESVEIAPRQIDSGLVDLQIRVKEKPTGSFSVGGGFSSADGLVALMEITQGNLFGRGQLLRGRAELGERRNTFSLTFREPYLLDYRVAMTTDLFNQERDFDSFKEDRRGGDVIFSREFTERLNGSIGTAVENREIFDVPRNADGSCAVDGRICAEEDLGRTSTRSLLLSAAYDTRDFFFDPSRGYRHSISYEHAGTVLGGTNEFYKVVLDSRYYFSLWWDTVFSVRGRLGNVRPFADREVPLGERFYVGGINTVRGFEFGKAGPLDPNTNEPIGATKELIFGAEYVFPLLEEAKLKGVVFFDAGKGFEDRERLGLSGLRTSAGFGIRLLLPIGPIRLEWGKNLDPRPGEESGFLPEFSIGSLF